MKQLIVLITSIFIFSGCSIVNEYDDSFKFKYLQSSSKTDFTDLTSDLLEPLCPTFDQIKLYKERNIPIYVTDFVNLENLENNSNLGFVLSDEMKSHVTQKCDLPVHAIEYSKYLMFGERGTKLLSRDLNDIKNTNINQNSYALVGTYSITQRQLILYLKLIDLSNGIILKSTTEKTTINDEIIYLEKSKKSQINTTNIQKPMVL